MSHAMPITREARRESRSIVLWHVHGSWTQAFVAGRHRYLIPVTDDGGADGRGLAGRQWPGTQEVHVDDLRDQDVDLVVLQRPHEAELFARWSGRTAGTDVPAVYVEHNAPRPHTVHSVHPMAHRTDIPVVHVTDFNRLMWDNGRAPTHVIAHGLDDPGQRYTGEIAAAATMINEPIRRGRTVGTDLLEPLSAVAPIDVWGIGTGLLNCTSRRQWGVTGHGDVAAPRLWAQVSQRRVYLHTARWTSLGLSLLEAMLLGMPVVTVAATMAPLVIPADAGVVSADVATLGKGIRRFLDDPRDARTTGTAAREFALAHFGLRRFLDEWEDLIEQACR